MTTTSTQPATSGSPSAGDPRPGCTPAGRITRSLLGWGVLAGPFSVVVSLAQAPTRDGFDLTRHEWNLLAARLRREGRRPMAGWTALTGGALLVAFAAIATGSAAPAPTVAFAVAVVLTWVWLSVLSTQLYRTVS